jgi:hypothetical protein
MIFRIHRSNRNRQAFLCARNQRTQASRHFLVFVLGFGMLALGDAPSFAGKATAEAAPPERGFVSMKPGNSWEEAVMC